MRRTDFTSSLSLFSKNLLQAKAEFGRILCDPKALVNMADNYSKAESKVLGWAERIASKSIKQLVSAMKAMLLEDPNRREDIESTVVALILQSQLKEKSCGSRNLFFMICSDDDSIDEEVAKTTYPRVVASGDLGSLNPIYIAVEGQIYLDLSGKRIPVCMVVALVMNSFYILDMEYTPEVSNVYAFLEATLMGKHGDAKKRISVQKFIKELGLNLG
ncbi:uncharacterized protein LOC114537272 [Dendronephthya gigantea]|uniref:uncharacterized protein LOC114537272 n=1 Tax=Dendronephthya gigantea TaxID=151771 RepID=UPI00106B2D6C|nr:uncharacterized protein LOC114537272 [Dendronephthya gigantea]